MRKRMLSIISILLVALMLQGCPAATSSGKNGQGQSVNEVAGNVNNNGNVENQAEEDSQAIDCVLLVSVNYESNIALAKYSINIFLDGEEIATVANGSEYFGSFNVKSGNHELRFEKNGDPDTNNTYSFNVESNCTAYCSLKSHLEYIEITEKNATGEAVCPEDQHQWEEATCLSPKTCKVCGATEGELADHTLGAWQTTKEATCTEEGEESCVCSVCGETMTRKVDKIPHTFDQRETVKEATCSEEGEERCVCSVCGETITQKVDKLPHNYGEWEIVKNPTCTEEGEESCVCSVCGETMTRKIDKTPHEPGDWTITKEATFTDPGVRVKKCKVCGEVLENESYHLSEEEQISWLKNNCKTGMYETISRNPTEYKGEFVKFTCKIVQVCSEAKSADYYSTYRGATSGSYDDVAYLLVENYGKERILEDDKITVYGVFNGLYTYTTVMGSSVTIPEIIVLYYE